MGATEEFQKVNEAYNALLDKNHKFKPSSSGFDERMDAADFQSHAENLDPRFGQKLRREMEKTVRQFARDHYEKSPRDNSQRAKIFAVVIFLIPLVFFVTFCYERERKVVAAADERRGTSR